MHDKYLISFQVRGALNPKLAAGSVEVSSAAAKLVPQCYNANAAVLEMNGIQLLRLQISTLHNKDKATAPQKLSRDILIAPLWWPTLYKSQIPHLQVILILQGANEKLKVHLFLSF